MINLDAAVARLPIVLVVDPVAASRQALWRLLSQSFGVLEAPDARRAGEWLACRSDIDAIVLQRDLPDVPGDELVRALVTARVAAASRTIIVTRPVDMRAVLTSLTRWFFAGDVRRPGVLAREAHAHP